MNLIETVIAVSIFPVELLFATFIYLFPLKHKKHFCCKLLIGSLLYCGGLFLLAIPLGAIWYSTLTYATFCAISSLCAAGLICFCCNANLHEAINSVAAAYATQHMTYCLHCLICKIDEPDMLSKYSVWYVLIYFFVYFACYLLFAKEIALAPKYTIKAKYSLAMALFTLSVTLGLSSASQYFKAQSRSLYTITMLYAIFSCFMLLANQQSRIKALKAQNELNLRERLWAERKVQYEISRESISLINQKCHDLKHQIGALRAMPESDEREHRLRKIEQSVMVYDAIVESGNDTIDTVLTEKSLICERNKIVLTCIADGKCLDFIDTIDLYTIFGNALDNAIECVSNLQEAEKRIISVSIFARASFAFIQCENFFEREIIMSDGFPQSTKEQNGYHGYGIMSIRQIAEKYGGFVTIETKNNIFMLRVTIPLA